MTDKKYIYFILSLFLLVTSCIRQQQPRLSQSLEGTIVNINDILDLQCVLETGNRLEQRASYSDATHFNLEVKRGRDYKPVKEQTVVYNGVDVKGNEEKGYINKLGYVSIKSIRDKGSRFQKEDSSSSSITDINCSNLITPDHHSLFIGKSHYSYDLRFQIIGSHMRALVVAPAKDIPHQALAYSLKLKDDLYAMPIGGYNADLGYLEEVVNSDWEATRILTFRSVPVKERQGYSFQDSLGIPSTYPNRADGTPVKHMRMSGSFMPFKTLLESGKKQDVYHKNLFQGEWYFTQVAINRNAGGNSWQQNTGMQSAYDSQFKEVSSVRIVLKDNFLVAYTLDVEDIDSQDVVSFSKDRWVFKIPIEHLDYWANSSGKDLNAGLQEIRNETQDIHKRPWVKVDFNAVETPIFQWLANAYNTRPHYRMEQVTISEDYLSFVLKDDVDQSSVKFSLLRPKKNSQYKPVYMNQKLYELFPAIFSHKRVHSVNKAIWSERYQTSYPVNLFDISRPIVYHFSHLTPKQDYVRNIGRETVNLWNQAFKKAGVFCPQGDCFVLDETKDVELGDLRYNVLNLLAPEDLLSSSLLGYGPMVSDFRTGEILSATSNVYLSSYYSFLQRQIYYYIMGKAGLISSHYENYFPINSGRSFNLSPLKQILKNKLFTGSLKKLFLPSYMISSWNPEKQAYNSIGKWNGENQAVYGIDFNANGEIQYITSVADLLTDQKDQESLALQYKMAMRGKEVPRGTSLDEMYESVKSHKRANEHECFLRGGFVSEGDRVTELIEQFCLKELEFANGSEYYINTTKNSPYKQLKWLRKQAKTEEFQDKITECSKKLLPIISLEVAIHESGHNLSMRHNFKGSTDKENTLAMDEYEHKYIFKDLNNEKVSELRQEKPVSASIMDYTGVGNFDFNPGGYDVAFLRLFYGGQLEKRDGGMLAVDLSSSKEKNVLEDISLRKLKHYEVCTDEDVGNSFDPFCQRFDVGSTATEIVNHFYNQYIGVPIDKFLSGAVPTSSMAHSSVYLFLIATLDIYHKWRSEISKYLDTDDPLYLTNLTADEYSKQIKELSANNPELQDLYNAREVIVQTYSQIFLALHDKYCLVTNHLRNDQQELIAFSELHHFLSQEVKLNRNVSSCDEMSLLLSHSGRTFQEERGIHLLPGRFSTSPYPARQIHNAYDYAGSIGFRAQAFFGLSINTYSAQSGAVLGIMDEPDVRLLTQTKLLDRILYGVNFAEPQRSPFDGSVQLKNKYFRNFSNEEFFWNFTSFPTLMRSSHSTNQVKQAQGVLERLIFLQPARRTNRFSEIFIYSHYRNLGGYFMSGDSELNQFNTSMELTAVSPNSMESVRLIRGIRSNELSRSIVNAMKTFNKHFSKTKEEKNSFEIRVANYNKVIKDAISALSELYADTNIRIPVLTFTTLMDHLERNERESEMAPSMIQVIQAGDLLQSKKEQLFSSTKDYFEVFTNKEGKKYKSLNVAKPLIDSLIQKLKSEPNIVEQHSDIIKELYISELFAVNESETSVKIKELFNFVTSRMSIEDQEKAKLRFSKLQSNIQKINKLKVFVGNKFTQEIFIRNMHLFSGINDFRPKNNVEDKYGCNENPNSSRCLLVQTIESENNPISNILFVLSHVSINNASFSWNDNAQSDKTVLNAIREFNSNPPTTEDKKLDASQKNYYMEAIYKKASFVHDVFILNKNMKELFNLFAIKSKNIVEHSFGEVLEISSNASGIGILFEETKDGSLFYEFFNNKISKELISQSNIIFNSINPYILLAGQNGHLNTNELGGQSGRTESYLREHELMNQKVDRMEYQRNSDPVSRYLKNTRHIINKDLIH